MACIHMAHQESWLATVRRPLPATWTFILRGAATEATWVGGLWKHSFSGPQSHQRCAGGKDQAPSGRHERGSKDVQLIKQTQGPNRSEYARGLCPTQKSTVASCGSCAATLQPPRVNACPTGSSRSKPIATESILLVSDTTA